MLGIRPLQFLGRISYSLYPVHWSVRMIVHEALGIEAPLPALLGVALVANGSVPTGIEPTR